MTHDTIVAISTPPGRGGIGIVRVSGPEAVGVAQQLLSLKLPLQHAHARFTRILDEDSTVIDEAVVTAFLAPNSYTGEDLVEIAAHGSPVVLDYIVRRALTLGARIAEPGEFSRRAFLAGRLDLTQAEAIHDLIAAQTLAQARTAAQQLGGALSRRVAPIKLQLVHLIAMLEAGMDFATGELDDVDTMPPSRIAAAITSVQEPLAALAASFRFGSIQRNGIRLALVGRPNAGKSSLFNRLLDRDRAIVTPTPGTTRDTIEETFSLDGIPVHLIDTAGLRGGQSGDGDDGDIDEAEALGIARSREALAEADLILLVRDAASEEVSILSGVQDPLLDLEGRPVIRILNKIDLLVGAGATGGEILTSALTGAGLDDLRAAVLAHLRAGSAGVEEGALNNLRQHAAVTDALHALDAAALANENHLPHELLLVDLHASLTALDTLTGVTTTDDILALIFSTFCIGK
jgi:tRNA modification GTPase